MKCYQFLQAACLKFVRFHIVLVKLCIVTIVFCCCKKTISSNPAQNRTPKTFGEVFDDYWKEMNRNYVYWDIDKTNWDVTFDNYRPLFNKLRLNDKNDVQKSIQYFREMTANLVDHHYQITFESPSVKDTIVYPSLMEKKLKYGYRDPYSYFNIDLNYLDSGFVSGYDNTTIPNEAPLFALCGKINEKILFFACSKFSLRSSYNSRIRNEVQTVLKYFSQEIHSDLKGIILDVRNNPGGDIGDLNFLIGQLIDAPLHFGYTRYKSGDGRFDFTPWVNAVINPSKGGRRQSIPIIVIADNFSVSLSEAVVFAIHSLPNGTFLGEKTWGATGPVIDNKIYNDGPFNITGFMSVYMSSAQFKYLDGKLYEGEGANPDVVVPYNANAIKSGIDTQLEKAIWLINHL